MAYSPEQMLTRWRRLRPKHRPLSNPLGLLALINLGLLIMLFLLIHASFVRQPAMTVQLPGASLLSGTPYDLLAVTLTQEGLVFFNDERVPLETLAGTLARAAQDRQIRALTIEADLRVPYGTLVRVMNMASAAGIQEIHLATRPLFGEEVLP